MELPAATRRTFLGAVSAASYQRILGANDRVGVGFIGYGLIGARHVEDFRKLPDVRAAAVCDVYQARLEQGVAACGAGTRGYSDFRKLLEDRDVDAVVVSTPDHWHALQTMLACAAGKDVFVEKPVTLFISEGRAMVTAARRFNRVVTAGTQQRSGPHFQEAVRLVQSGYLGRVHSIRIGAYRNITPGFGRTPDSQPPDGLDYDRWLGPAPRRPYTRHRALYHFRWFWDYSGGQMTNLGAHEIDIVHWAMRMNGPLAVSSSGGRFALEDDGETPDTQDALFEYPGFTVEVAIREACTGKGNTFDMEFYGTKASMALGRSGFSIAPEMRIRPENAIPNWSTPAGHPSRVVQPPEPFTEPREGRGTSDEQMHLHARNFIDCVKSRQRPVADIEDAHRVSAACHLANISLRLGRKLRWDAASEQIIGDREAAAQLTRPYRAPWDEAFRSLAL